MTSTGRAAGVKRVICTRCDHPTEVPQRAMSIFCPHCKKRLILEDFKIRTYYAVREFFTCGDIVVERKGHVVAPVRVGTLTVKGTLRGTVTARGPISVRKKGSLTGDVEAPSLVVENGAMLDGFVRIGPAG
ncbi:MAG: polymer-forming cytoskeletal protein [Phycisphaerae bacterium]